MMGSLYFLVVVRFLDSDGAGVGQSICVSIFLFSVTTLRVYFKMDLIENYRSAISNCNVSCVVYFLGTLYVQYRCMKTYEDYLETYVYTISY